MGWRRDPPDRRRAARAPRGGAACRDARADPPARGPGDDHQRLSAGAQGAGAPGRRAAPDHGQPRQPRQLGVRRRQRRRLPGRARAGGDRGAAAAGLGPIKINMVVKRGVNEDSVVPMARHFRGSGHIVRFIQYMDVGHSNGWRMDEVVPAAEIVAMIGAKMPLEPNYPVEVVERWRYGDGSGEIGVIASVTRPFCGGCTRARLSAEGKLFTCLFAVAGHDLRALLRGGAFDGRSPRRSAGSVGCGRTATRSCARPRQPACPRLRCPTSAGRPLGRGVGRRYFFAASK